MGIASVVAEKACDAFEIASVSTAAAISSQKFLGAFLFPSEVNMVERALSGLEIATSIKATHREGDTNLADVSQMLVNSHARRPGLWGDDLKLANEALHDRGLLPNVDLVGVRGQDFIVLAQQYAKIAEQARAAALRQSQSEVAQQQAEAARRASIEASTRA